MGVPPLERGTSAQPQLPEGMTLDDLRFVNPETYALHMAWKGWTVVVGGDVDGNPVKVGYSLSREITDGFDVTTLGQKIGVINEQGETLDGYSLGIIHRDGQRHDKPTLDFKFRGFPTEKTMQVLESLEREFLPEGEGPERRKRNFRLLASATSGPETGKASKPRTIFERVRHGLGLGRN
jgi:hypothetical protein